MSDPFMTQRSLQVAAILLFASLPALLRAQEASAMEDERMRLLAERNAEAEQWFGPRNKVSVGFRFLLSGGRVDFGHLGAVPAKVVAAASAGAVNRVYDDGAVHPDGLRTDESDANGNQLSTPGGRYATYERLEDGTIVQQSGDFTSFTPGRTRNWEESTEAQLSSKPGYMAFTNYSTTSEGGAFSNKPGASAGVELQFSHDIGRLTRRIQWGFMTGVTLNSISSKSSGSVISALNSRTDYYAVLVPAAVTPGNPVTAPAFGPDYGAFSNAQGTVYPQGYETSAVLNQTPDESLTSTRSVAGGATVNGLWQVKGAYFMVKVGPSFRAQFNDRLELSGSAGFAAAYVGTTYTATESFSVAGLLDYTKGTTVTADDGTTTTTYPVKTDVGVIDPQSTTMTKFLAGYYADLTFEWAANETTGLFGGVTAQRLDAYTQNVAERTARIDLGSTVGVRGGISIKF